MTPTHKALLDACAVAERVAGSAAWLTEALAARLEADGLDPWNLTLGELREMAAEIHHPTEIDP